MATTVTFNGVNYSIPAVNEEDWQSLSNYLIALQNAAVAGGPVRQNIRVSTSSTTAVATTDYVVLINYAGAATVNLPAGVDEQVFVIADASGNASTNNITINRNGFNNILGGASYVLDKDNQSIILGFHAGQGNWYRIAESIPGAIEGPASSVVGGLAAFANTTGDSLQDLGVGSANQVLVTDGTTPSFALIANANVSGSAAIAYSKLALTNSIVNADISSGAAIAYSKLTLTGSIVNADINASAAIAYSKLNLSGSIVNSDVNASAAIDYSKLNLSGSIVNADVNASAAIAYSKLNLTGSIVNADVNASAAIAYSKLTLTGSIVNADINASAAIARSKIASGSASHVVVNDGAGALSSVATLPVSQGGTGLNTLGSALQVLRVDSLGTSLEFATLAAGSGDVIGPASSVTNGIVQFASTTGKALKDLGVGSANQVLLTNGTAPSFGQITNAYIDATAAIDFSKMAALTASRALETNGSGFIVASAVTSTELGYVSGVTSAIQTQIDSKTGIADNETITGNWTFNNTITGSITGNAGTVTNGAYINVTNSFTSTQNILATTNQLVLGTTNTTTISATAPASSAVYTIPDVGTIADFVLTAGTQTIGGAKTFSSTLTTNALIQGFKSGTPVTFSADVVAGFQNSSTSATSAQVNIVSGDTGSAWFMFGKASDANYAGIRYDMNADKMHFHTSNNLTAGQEVVTISGGNVGIGTSSPGNLLDVGGINPGDGLGITAAGFSALQRGTFSDQTTTGPYTEVVLGVSSARGHAKGGAIISGREGIYSTTASTQDSYLAFETTLDGVRTEKMRISSAGAVTLGPAPVAATNGVLHRIATGDQASVVNLTTAQAGYMQVGNSHPTLMAPAFASVTSDNNISAMAFFAAASDTNNIADMVFDVRENDNTDFATLTNKAFRFTRIGNELLTITRAGAVTLGPSTGLGTVNVPTGVATTLFDAGQTQFRNRQIFLTVYDAGTHIGSGAIIFVRWNGASYVLSPVTVTGVGSSGSTVSISGTNIQFSHTAGSTRPISWNYIIV